MQEYACHERRNTHIMSYVVEDIGALLRQARERRGLSQRRLGAVAGVPQAHISRIENGSIDLRVSSLAAIAHALDLRLSLIPRRSAPTVNAVVADFLEADPAREGVPESCGRTTVPPPRPAYRLEDDTDE